MNGKRNTNGRDTTLRARVSRWLRPADLSPAEADALRGVFPVEEITPARRAGGLTPAEAEALSRGVYPAARGGRAARRGDALAAVRVQPVRAA